MTVVGEIADIKQTSATAPTQSQIYTPFNQLKVMLGSFAPPDLLTGSSGSIVLRSILPPEQMADSLRTTVRSIDPQLPLAHIESMEHVVQQGQASRRFSTLLISSFAAAAVLLPCSASTASLPSPPPRADMSWQSALLSVRNAPA